MFTVTRALAILFIAISGVAAATSASTNSTQPATAATHASTPSATTKKNAGAPASKVAPAAVVGGIVFVGANLALGF
ncbi:hypothetical protein FRC11_005825 [Ceratobasidium sp. 423]|nr:hypothetical protein FRC11_005825 [Ceratobasidium sp. 423]